MDAETPLIQGDALTDLRGVDHIPEIYIPNICVVSVIQDTTYNMILVLCRCSSIVL